MKVIHDCHCVGLCVLQQGGVWGMEGRLGERCNQEEYPRPLAQAAHCTPRARAPRVPPVPSRASLTTSRAMPQTSIDLPFGKEIFSRFLC